MITFSPNMDLKKNAAAVRAAIDEYRNSVNLSFTEKGHIYNIDGLEKPISTTGIVSRYYEPFDRDTIAAKVAAKRGDEIHEVIAEWEEKGRIARNVGSYVHYHLENYLVEQFELDKEVREPFFDMDDAMLKRGNELIIAGKAQADSMADRGATLVDTEVVMGHPRLGYVGQCDCLWLAADGQLVLTDWKTNKPSKFKNGYFDKPMYYPFEDTNDNAVGKYSLQLGLYERLLLAMLEGSEVSDLRFKASIIVSLLQRPVGSFNEYALDGQMRSLIYNMETEWKKD